MFFAAIHPLQAEVRLPAVFGDHMVLQRDTGIPVWGWADAGETVTVTAGGDTASATAAADGSWRATLQKLKPSDQPIELTLSGKNSITLHDVLVGDVWLCSGQSNMQYQLGGGKYGFGGVYNAEEEIRQADHPTLRLFVVTQTAAMDPQHDCHGSWQVCTPETAARFSAVGYFFGRDIQADQHVPVGLIDSSFGGTYAQAWISLDALKSEPALAGTVNAYQTLKDKLPELRKKYEPIVASWQARTDQTIKQWNEATVKAKAAGTPPPPRPYTGGKPWPPGGNPNTPTVLSSTMIAPLVPFALKGVIWYQGESNSPDPQLYQTLFPTLIKDWRARWGQGDFPFLWVQLSAFQPNPPKPNQRAQDWPGLREAQTMALRLPHTGQAITIDIGAGRDIHPKDKVDVGHRLALVARNVAYGEAVTVSGPKYESMKVEADQIRVTFSHATGGLMIGAPPATQPSALSTPSKVLTGFTIAGANHRFVAATATIDGNTVVVSSPTVHDPQAVRYAWADDPVCNLYNTAHLPAEPFRTDRWDDPLEPTK